MSQCGDGSESSARWQRFTTDDSYSYKLKSHCWALGCNYSHSSSNLQSRREACRFTQHPQSDWSQETAAPAEPLEPHLGMPSLRCERSASSAGRPLHLSSIDIHDQQLRYRLDRVRYCQTHTLQCEETTFGHLTSPAGPTNDGRSPQRSHSYDRLYAHSARQNHRRTSYNIIFEQSTNRSERLKGVRRGGAVLTEVRGERGGWRIWPSVKV